MSQPLEISSFEEWISYIFDHPVSDPAWHWDIDVPQWNEEDHNAEVVAYMTELFENAQEVLKPFSNAQLNQGFCFLASNSCSNHMYALLDEVIPWYQRRRCIQSMETLFRNCFAQRCSSHISHGQHAHAPDIDVLNSACYMWFDLVPIHAVPKIPANYRVYGAFLEVIERILYIRHDACRESGLHGVGEWSCAYGRKAYRIVERYVRRTPKLRPELIDYAHRAAIGYIL